MSLTNINTISTRIKLKYDTYTNWENSTLPILPGEMCVALVDLGQNEVAGAQIIEGENASAHQVGYKPAILVKIGDGIKKFVGTENERYKYFSELDYIQAKAGDVYAWAKAETAPTAVDLDIGANASQAQKNKNGQTIWAWLNTLDTKTYEYELEVGENENTGKIRLKYRVLNSGDSFSTTNWISVGQTISCNDNTLNINGGQVGVKISSDTGNILSVSDTSTKEGLYVPKITVDNTTYGLSVPADGTINVVTNISAHPTNNQVITSFANIYTKDTINKLLNPSMEFKGVKSASQLAGMTIESENVGDSYKINNIENIGSLSSPFNSVKVGDVAIVVANEVANSDPVEYTYSWVIIPSGDDSVGDTWRPIYVDNTILSGEVLDYANPLNIRGGTGIVLTATASQGDGNFTNDELIIGIDTSSIATKSSVDTLTNLTSGLGSYTSNGATVNHTVKTYVDQNIAAATNSVDVSKLTESTIYLVLDCGDAGGWDSYSS